MARWTDLNAMPHVPAAMLEEQLRQDQMLHEAQRVALHAGVTEYEPDEHTIDLGVGAADMECVFQIHMFDDEDDEE
jgi:hypothetical protein